ncbi:pentatricopeptide repeat-containing protein At1g77360, mitochondrial-like [Punica granatum]|uniref:Pentatricopeptide repeat-containing protein At1g77360, mitochondrial-like n=1 Tax=Punica granatum TaxID=22663 RepID=A0A6P8DR09_PUNGR|nr:pentatricopeptide repeat-containing protein At1g77360, mitochondrial-like [Punica granatum]
MGGNGRKRPHNGRSRSPSSRVLPFKKPQFATPPSSKSPPPRRAPDRQPGAPNSNPSRPGFASYLDPPNLPPKIKILCEIIATTHSLSVERVLDHSISGLPVTQEDVEQVLKLSYGFPGSAVKFFRWSARLLCGDHSPYAWNLVVDMLGKNELFDAMWDAIKSMHKERLLSLATLASVFSSYVIAGRVHEAIMTFDVMDQYGVPRDIVALNSLLSAICREGKVVDAVEFLQIEKQRIRPDPDSYAILLEGCEKEGNTGVAKLVFSDMVAEIGWDPSNLPAYNSLLCTLIRGPDGVREAVKYFETMGEHRCYPSMKFFREALDDCLKRSDSKGAEFFWGAMMEKVRLRPDTEMYNLMIAMYCHQNEIELAKRLLDEMICNGAFPDDQTYNVLLEFLIKCRKLVDASIIFSEMIKNECSPSLDNCQEAIRVFLDTENSTVALKVWKWTVENYKEELEDTANLLIVGLRDMDRLPEAVKYAKDIIDRKIKLNSSTLSKLKESLTKAGKDQVYDEILWKWKFR